MGQVNRPSDSHIIFCPYGCCTIGLHEKADCSFRSKSENLKLGIGPHKNHQPDCDAMPNLANFDLSKLPRLNRICTHTNGKPASFFFFSFSGKLWSLFFVFFADRCIGRISRTKTKQQKAGLSFVGWCMITTPCKKKV